MNKLNTTTKKPKPDQRPPKKARLRIDHRTADEIDRAIDRLLVAGNGIELVSSESTTLLLGAAGQLMQAVRASRWAAEADPSLTETARLARLKLLSERFAVAVHALADALARQADEDRQADQRARQAMRRGLQCLPRP